MPNSTYIAHGRVPVDLASGETLAPGEKSKNVDPDAVPDSVHIAEGRLAELAPKSRKSKATEEAA
jgi:D-aminopeptidase